MAKILLPLQNFFPDKEVNVPVVTARCVSGALQEVCTRDLIQSWLSLWVILDKLVYFPGLGFFPLKNEGYNPTLQDLCDY